MSEKIERQKHGKKELQKYMRDLRNGSSINEISRRYGINHVRLKVLWEQYQKEGEGTLCRKRNVKSDYALKRQTVHDICKNHITLASASLKYGASASSIGVWLKRYRTEGLAALKEKKKRGRPPGMGRPKKNSKPLTELERLQKENQELKTEIALLKKVRALVEERESRLKEIGCRPSKN